MKILFDDPNRPQDLFQINSQLLANGETVEVEDGYGYYLLKTYPDRLKRADEPAVVPTVVAAIVPAVENVATEPVAAEAERAAE